MIERKAQRWIKSQDGHDNVQDKVNDALQGERRIVSRYANGKQQQSKFSKASKC